MRSCRSRENIIVTGLQDDPYKASDFVETCFHAAEISPDPYLRPESSTIDTMEYTDVMNLFVELGMKISKYPGINRNSLKEKLYGGTKRGSSDEKARYLVNATKKDKAVKRQLQDIYPIFIKTTNMDTFKNELRKPLQKRFPGFIKHMKVTLDTVQKDSSEFQIIITGAASAGKSMFLNILLGAKILPSTLLRKTSCICRLHNSLDKKISYADNHGNKTIQLTSDNPEEIEEALMKIIDPKTTEGKKSKSLRVVDIYWSIPLLREDVILVDTPGICETTVLTKQMVEYLAKADGYICVIDSSHAGGDQQDMVLHLLQEVKRKQGSKTRDFSNFLFVCNKWDLVQDEDVDRVWESIWQKLTSVCGMLEKWQVIKLCTKLELELLNLKANHTDEYEGVLTGIENVRMVARDKRIGCHLVWIHKFMMEMNNLIFMKINGDGSNLLTSQERSAFLATKITTFESYIKTGVKVEQDAKTKNDLSRVLYEFRNIIKDHLRRLQTIHMIYGERNVVAFKELEIGQILSKTDAFHLYNVKGIFEGKAVTLRMINPHLSVYYMKEIENIRAMDHVNFATHVAMVPTLPEFMETSHSNDDWLRLLTEPCVGDLETYVLSHRNEIGSVAGESAKETFIHIAYGISNGLEYIHSKGFVHGQLQLSAVLLCTHMVPKLCDLNVLPYYKDRSYNECIYHAAPEVIRDGTCGPEADVYSYGILLWELWYGRHTKQSKALSELIVCSGGRPRLEDKRPPQDLEALITRCWDGQVNRRPMADVLKKLLKPNQII